MISELNSPKRQTLSEQIAKLKTVARPDLLLVSASGQEILSLQAELERAWRAIQGFWTAAKIRQVPDQAMLGYHSPTIAAAVRFVQDDATDGADFFIGKPIEILQNVLKR